MKTPTLEQIKEEVEEKTGLDLLYKSQKQSYVTAKYIYFGIAYKYTTKTLSEIGNTIGKDHSTVVYGLETLEQRLHYENDMAIVKSEIENEYDKHYNPNNRTYKDARIKNKARRKRRIVRKINLMTEHELKKIEKMIQIVEIN